MLMLLRLRIFFLLKSPFFTKQFFINNTLWFLRQLFLLFNYFLHHLCIHLKRIFWLGSIDEKSLVIMMKTIQFLEVLVQVFKMNRIDRSWEYYVVSTFAKYGITRELTPIDKIYCIKLALQCNGCRLKKTYELRLKM